MLAVRKLAAGPRTDPRAAWGHARRRRRARWWPSSVRMGPGKSTLLNTVVGMLRPRGGRVVFNERDVTGRAPSAWSARVSA